MSNFSEEEISQIVAKSLHLVLSGKSSIESILFRYPELVDILRPELETAMLLERVRSQFSPSPGFVKRSKARLMERIEQEAAYPQAAYHHVATGNGGRARAAKSAGQSWMWRFAAMAAVLMLLFVSFTGTVYAARDTVPGDGLYGFKRWTEETTYSLTSDLSQQARLRLAFSSRRLEEANQLLSRGQTEQAGQVLEEYQRQVEQAVEILEKAKEAGKDNAGRVADEMVVELERHTERLKGMEANAPGSMNILESAMKASMRGSDQLGAMGTGRPTETPSATPGAPVNAGDNTVNPGEARKTNQPNNANGNKNETDSGGASQETKPAKETGSDSPRETKTPKSEKETSPKGQPTSDATQQDDSGNQNKGDPQDKGKPDKP